MEVTEKNPLFAIAIPTRINRSAIELKTNIRLCCLTESVIFFAVILAIVMNVMAINMIKICSEVQYLTSGSFIESPPN